MHNKKVIFDHDGGVDDLLALMLVLSMDNVDLVGVTITPADCYLPDATESTLKILSMFGRQDIPVAQGRYYGINAFPADWRAQPKICNALPRMLTTEADSNNLLSCSAPEAINHWLQAHDGVTVLMTGPCSNLVHALQTHPHNCARVNEVVWMGGAVDVAGNVATHNHDTSAEWNAFWDPKATQQLFTLGLKIKLISLDATNSLPVNKQFLVQLAAQQQYPMSDLAGQFWATTINSIPAYEFTYYMWDVLAACYLGLPEDCIPFVSLELDVSTHEPNAGQTFRSPGNGQWVDVAQPVDKQRVLDYVLQLLRR
ncbi:nucleoside hydrolase [Aestuariibacter halophilus]|uniref:Nucleoside hydrolase n=1 Tax=Fluctibacter halophilus TaxID=226011 RepID=A0ABS8G5H6_9ALTE|nr:nucleoside hydrolase [Aestuariibacter halophilus]MCC2615847.1 nucleoside hydrolase [Aestuariibacter halophilus]